VESTAYEINVLKVGEGRFPREILGCHKYRRRGNSRQGNLVPLHCLKEIEQGHPGKRKGVASHLDHGSYPHLDKLIWAISLWFKKVTLEIQFWRGKDKR
jgi:hypothetical protein